MKSINTIPHLRKNILTDEWVLVSPQRTDRPWQGDVEKSSDTKKIDYDPNCYLCPGNKRAGNKINPKYEKAYSFKNDFPALIENIENNNKKEGLLESKSEKGICKVICFSPNHSLTIPNMEIIEIEKVIETWIIECKELGKKSFINHIQIFENKGSVMGCSNPHPHCQVWAQESIPVQPLKKQREQKKYFDKNNKVLLLEYLRQEIEMKERIVYENEHFVLLVPYWAVWPFETMIIPKRNMQQIVELTKNEITAFADAYKELTIKYDNIFNISFPYSAGIHQAPFDGKKHKEWQWHMVFYPPLLRSATVKKFMVGYEMLANPQRDITAEFSAEKLKDI